MRRNPLLMTVMGNPRHPSRASVEAKLDKMIEAAYYRHAQGVQVSVMDIPKIFRDVKLEMAGGADVDTAVKMAVAKYRVNQNPCSYKENPFILIDSGTNKIIRAWRGSMTDRKPWDWAKDAARRLGRPVFIVAHPYVPSTFRAGVEVSPLFYFGGPFQEVRPDGSVGRGPAGGYKKNPSLAAGVMGGIAGTLVTNALSNPAISPWAVCRAMKRRHGWSEAKTERCIRKVKAKRNPSPSLKAGDKQIIANAVGRLHVGMSDQAVEGFIRSKIKRPPSQGLLRAAIRYALEVHHRNQDLYRKVQSGRFSNNPGSKKRTIPIAQFAKMVRSQNDPKLWTDFVKKVRGYHKWTHGSWPSSVTLEAVRKPGVSGIWITYAIGKTPESTYMMPGGSQRKGAWKHRWERMPEMKGDPEAGIILTKLAGRNRLTNFMHG